MPDRNSIGPQPRGSKLVRVVMYTHASGPDGMLEPGHTYDRPRDVAERLIESGAARLAEEQPADRDPPTAEPEYPGPWSEDNWWEGVSLSDWAAWRDPEAWAQQKANCHIVVSLEYEDERSSRLCSEAARRLKEVLKVDLKSGRIVLGYPGDPAIKHDEYPTGHSAPVPKDSLSKVVKEIAFGSGWDPGKVSWQMPGNKYAHREVVVYPPGRFATEEVQEAKPKRATKDRRGRKTAFDHGEARRELVRFLAEHHGKPRAQADLETHLLEWLAREDLHPAASTAREFVSKEFGFLWDRNS